MTVESPWNCKKIKPTNCKGNQPWIFTGRTNAKAEAPMLWLPDIQLFGEDATLCWERLRARGEGGDRGWDGLMASLTQWTWDWSNSRRQWGIGKPGMVQSMGLQRVGHYWATEEQQKSYKQYLTFHSRIHLNLPYVYMMSLYNKILYLFPRTLMWIKELRTVSDK